MKSWAIPASIIVAIEYVFAFSIGARVGFHYRIPFETYMIVGLTFAGLGISLIIVAQLAMYALQHETAPTRRLIREGPYPASFAIGVLLCALQISVLTWTKVMLPVASPFWADALLANLDHVLFRTDPWMLADRLFGWAAPLIDRAYVTWAPIKFLTLIVVLCMPESRSKAHAMLSYFLMMAVVAVGQYTLSSAGPVFYARLGFGPRFENMPMEPWVASARDYLWHDYLNAGGAVGGGISAMPSLHVAAALWMALVWRRYQPIVGAGASAYFGLILIGSVLLGWHYAVDALVAVFITLASWVVGARLTATESRQVLAGAVPARTMSLSADA